MKYAFLIPLLMACLPAGAFHPDVDPPADQELAFHGPMQKIIEEMVPEQSRLSQKDFVKKLFIRMHRQVLTRFDAYASLDQTLQTGAYNCLTATALFAAALDYFNISHRIIETNYHVFMLVTVQGETWLVEATDPLNGLVSKPRQVEARLTAYRNMSPPAENAGQILYRYRNNYYNRLTLLELRGLDFFNQAVKCYNSGQLKKSVHWLQQAVVYYPSARIAEMAGVLWVSVNERVVDQKEKADLQRRLLIVQQTSLPALAAAR